MRIGLIGGIERSEALYRRLADGAGHGLEVHSGHIGGRGITTLESLIARVDVVVVLTEINSHGAVQSARRFARRFGVRELIVRRLGVARFTELLDELTTEQRRHACIG
ncbi:MAG: DUF2325 domain-containing protein [Polyangia bacterium]